MGKSLTHIDLKVSKKEAIAFARRSIKPGHWRVNKIKSGYRVHITE